MAVVLSGDSSEEGTAPDVKCLGVCNQLCHKGLLHHLRYVLLMTLEAPGYTPQDLRVKGSREYGGLPQEQDRAALRVGGTPSGLLETAQQASERVCQRCKYSMYSAK